MKIAYLTSRTVPHDEPDVQQMLQTAAALRVHGIEVDILLPRAWRQIFVSGQSLTELAAGHYNIPESGVSLVPLPPVLRLPGASRSETLDTVSTMLADVCGLAPAFFRAARGKYRMVYTRRWVMAAVATRLKIPAVFETYTAVSSGLLRKYCDLDFLVGVVAHSRLAARWLTGKGLPEERIFVCYNGYNPEDLSPVLERRQARSDLGLPDDRPIVCYAGRLKTRKAPDSIIQIARRTPEILYVLVGAVVGERERLQKETANVVVCDWVGPARLSRYLYAADVLMIPPSSLPLDSGRTVLPLKTFLYMASGRPIIGPNLPDLREVLEHHRNAILTTPDEPDEAADSLRALLSDPILRERLATTAAEDARDFTWQERGRRLAEFLRCRAPEIA